ncbi:MAG: hypothetical protein P0Y65_10345 [Candidatus Devosia phytovorans]|uniref:Uncharacterized protein n=1 Tax=Candidatus Devosia phytovorans TaxID=3121372 RepID=A0AAJ5VZ90_9HYPH|nr:hypothetical protein [Devosia sp.]WEK06615.1 MAG: hypothetical protein P0Y65_10345 [Devosia sp.]
MTSFALPGGFLLAAVIACATPSTATAQTPLPHDTALAIYFADEQGVTKPYLFYDANLPFQMSMCEARLDYLTKQYYRMTRSNPDFKGKTAVRSACVRIEGFDFGS